MRSEQYWILKRRLFLKNGCLLLALLLFLPFMFSCGDSGGDTQVAGGGIGGTGYTVGPITALGSIFVNGIEFETTNTAVTLNGVSANAADLQIGMVVKVEGVIHADGKTGKANAVIYDQNAEGPIGSIDLISKTLKVMGQTVLVDAQTVIAGLPGNATGLADLTLNDQVEISGLIDAMGNIKATRIAKKTTTVQTVVSGQVRNLTGTTFNVNTLVVDYSNAILHNFSTLGIMTGDFVSAKGTMTSETTMQAVFLEKKAPNFKNNDSIRVQGVIDSLYYTETSVSGFAMNTPFGLQNVELSAGTKFSGGQRNNLNADTRVQVEGSVINNVIQARQIDIL